MPFTDFELAVHKQLIALTASNAALRELLFELAASDPAARSRLEQSHKAAYARHLQAHLEKIEDMDPALAAQLDYRTYDPPL